MGNSLLPTVGPSWEGVDPGNKHSFLALASFTRLLPSAFPLPWQLLAALKGRLSIMPREGGQEAGFTRERARICWLLGTFPLPWQLLAVLKGRLSVMPREELADWQLSTDRGCHLAVGLADWQLSITWVPLGSRAG